MEIVEKLKLRGLFEEASDEAKINQLPKETPFYCGFDPSNSSLQVGNLIPVLAMATAAREGLKPIVLFGGSTGSIGDPSGKSAERNLLTQQQVNHNIECHKGQLNSIFERLQVKPTYVNNADWTTPVSIIEFLRDIGKHFTVNYMLQKESVKSRLNGSGISFTEFSYMILQAYDFYHLYKEHGCKLQVGGSDQWGNITAGLELIRKKAQGQAYALTFPLVTNSQGQKLGKSEGDSLFLAPEKTSPYKFHQYWLNVEDADAMRLVRMFTFIEQSKLNELEKASQDAPHERQAQKTLADALCTLVHGESATETAKKGAKVLFGGTLEGLKDSELLDIFSEVPSITIEAEKLSNTAIGELFVESGLVKSKGEAKRLAKNGGAYINNQRVEDETSIISDTTHNAQTVIVLRSGKKKYALIKRK